LKAQAGSPRVNGLTRRELQEGIYFRRRAKPPGFFTLVLLRATDGATAGEVADSLALLWKCYRGLQKGKVPDLRGTPPVPAGDLKVLLGLGTRAFTLPERPESAAALPAAMQPPNAFGNPDPNAGGGPIVPYSGISYAADVTGNPADATIALQFTAETPLAVERAAVETWKALHDNPLAALEVQTVYTGAKRDDGRSWIDFYDGLSNLRSAERLQTIAIPPMTPPPAADEWTHGGTYLAYMRLEISLSAWRALPVKKQEELVGRQKLSGLPLLSIDEPFRDPGDKSKPPHEADFTQLPSAAQATEAIRDSHVQRVNHHNPKDGGLANPQNHRIYRQGYPFLEPQSSPPGFRAGLNFVSFQSAPETLLGMFGQAGWLANTNFGGVDGEGPALLSARAAGVFLVPPRVVAQPPGERERFPGERALSGSG
jgi:deferrochelatase/peroxidase EfeB